MAARAGARRRGEAPDQRIDGEPLRDHAEGRRRVDRTVGAAVQLHDQGDVGHRPRPIPGHCEQIEARGPPGHDESGGAAQPDVEEALVHRDERAPTDGGVVDIGDVGLHAPLLAEPGAPQVCRDRQRQGAVGVGAGSALRHDVGAGGRATAYAIAGQVRPIDRATRGRRVAGRPGRREGATGIGQEGDERVILERVVGVRGRAEVQSGADDGPVDARPVQGGAEEVARRDAHAHGVPGRVVAVRSRGAGGDRVVRLAVRGDLHVHTEGLAADLGGQGVLAQRRVRGRRDRAGEGAKRVQVSHGGVHHVAGGVG